MFYARVLRTKFCRQKLQSSVLGLKFFGAKISYKKHLRKILMKHSTYGQMWSAQAFNLSHKSLVHSDCLFDVKN